MSYIRGTPLTQPIAELLNVPVTKDLSISDEAEGLVQIHYNDAEKYPQYRGWIIDLEEKRVIARSFDFAPEKVVKFDQLPNVPLTVAKEGTILRVYSREGKLCVSTHRKLDCKKSKWSSSKTFHEMFLEACERMKIDPESLKSDNKCYVLLLVHPENQIINQEIVEPTLFHLDTWERTEEATSTGLKLMKRVVCNIGLPVPGEATKEEIVGAWKEGKVLISMDSNAKVKYLSKEASERYQLRGNHPNIKMQWYALRSSGKHKKLLDVLPVAFKKEFENYDKERVSLEKDAVEHYLVPLYYQFVLKTADFGLTCGPGEEELLKVVQQQYYKEKGDKKGFSWGKNKKSLYNKVALEVTRALKQVDGTVLYKCLFGFVKHRKQRLHLEKPLIGYGDLPN